MRLTPTKGDALIVVDMQNDFITGSLAVPGASEIIGPVNDLVDEFRAAELPVCFTTDWHPKDHCSFTAQGGIFPPHCVAGTYGAEIATSVNVSGEVVRKGMLSEKDAFSGFDGTPLLEYLQQCKVSRVFVCGLATDFCVRATALDAVKHFTTIVMLDAIKGIYNQKLALLEMQNVGVQTAQVHE
jgi:nicotinamidase-related amidase